MSMISWLLSNNFSGYTILHGIRNHEPHPAVSTPFGKELERDTNNKDASPRRLAQFPPRRGIDLVVTPVDNDRTRPTLLLPKPRTRHLRQPTCVFPQQNTNVLGENQSC